MTSADNTGGAAGAVGSRSVWTFYALASGIVAIDQATKLIATGVLLEGEPVRVLGPVMCFTLQHNTGAAWGILAAHTRWLTWVAGVLVLLLALCGLRVARLPRLIAAGLPLLLGGALGNLADRIRLGAVVDFIDFHIWPVFNVADIAIVAGAVLIGYHLARHETTSGCQTAAENAECDQC